MQQSLHLRRIGSGICPANPFACDVAGEAMQFQSDRQSLLARHLTVTVNLFFQGGSRIHNVSIIHLRFADNCRNQPKIERGGDKQVGGNPLVTSHVSLVTFSSSRPQPFRNAFEQPRCFHPISPSRECRRRTAPAQRLDLLEERRIDAQGREFLEEQREIALFGENV